MPLVTEEIIFSSDPLSGAQDVPPGGDTFSVNFSDPIIVPKNAVQVEVQMLESVIWFTTPNITAINQNLRITGPDENNIVRVYNIVVPKGLYDLSALSAAILRELESAPFKAKQTPFPLLSFSADDATSKVIMYLNYDTVTVDFSVPNSLGDILGFDTDPGDNPIGPLAGTPLPQTAPNVARFNTINSFLVHCDLARSGIRLNNTYSQIIGNPLIDVAPGKQIIYSPQYPPLCEANHLRGQRRTRVKCWLTDDQNQAVDTNGEYWSFRLRLSYSISN
jgi:hypothetical protein